MSRPVFGALVLVSLIIACWSSSTDILGNIPTNREAEPTPQLVSLGRVGNKTFYAQRWTGNWTDSRDFCAEMNMKLGTIETEEERDLLSSKYEYAVFWGWHWTAARDSHAPSQLVWDNQLSNIDVSIPWLSDYPDTITDKQYLTCGAYIIEETYSGMAFQDCGKLNGHAICEKVY